MANGRSLVHVEIPASDNAASIKFYEALCGWKSEVAPMDSGDYVMFHTGNVGTALSNISDDNPAGNVLVYIGSDDLDADMKRVVELGGKSILPRQDVPGFGSLGIFQDVAGNTLAFWQDANSAG